MRIWAGVVGAALALAGCDVAVVPAGSGGIGPGGVVTAPRPVPQTPAPVTNPQQSPEAAVAMFRSVVARMEPVAERTCREQSRGLNCDFHIVVDTRRGQPANAFQTLGPDGRPIIAFTVPLLADVRNADELAFILGHEAAHHIEGHIARTQQSAALGGLLGGVLASVGGGTGATVETAQNIGATLGARRYSKGFELDADRLGTLITYSAGYDPARGAAYFERIPDPGDKFLGTHPPNAQRVETVRATLAGLRR